MVANLLDDPLVMFDLTMAHRQDLASFNLFLLRLQDFGVTGEHRRMLESTVKRMAAETPTLDGDLDDLSQVEERSALDLLVDVHHLLERFIVWQSPEQVDAVSLWILHTHCMDSAHTSARLWINSPQKRTGKTLTLEVIEMLVHRGILAASISAAVIPRMLTDGYRTFLVDEIDTIYGRKAHGNEDLRGLINSGFRRGAAYPRCGKGSNGEVTVEMFPTFAPVVLAGIEDLPGTIKDRAIRINLHRKKKNETVERFRHRKVVAECDRLRKEIMVWGANAGGDLDQAEPDLPAAINDRAQDFWEPLIAIADLAGGTWPGRARRAAVALTVADHDDDIAEVRILADSREVWPKEQDRIFTESLLRKLHDLEDSPWPTFHRGGRELTASGLARLLRPYGIKSQSIRTGQATAKGYYLDQFEPVWERYLDPQDGDDDPPGRGESPPSCSPESSTRHSRHNVTPQVREGECVTALRLDDSAVTAPSQPEIPSDQDLHPPCDVVTADGRVMRRDTLDRKDEHDEVQVVPEGNQDRSGDGWRHSLHPVLGESEESPGPGVGRNRLETAVALVINAFDAEVIADAEPQSPLLAPYRPLRPRSEIMSPPGWKLLAGDAPCRSCGQPACTISPEGWVVHPPGRQGCAAECYGKLRQ